MELPQEVRDLFAEEMAAKFLATVDPGGKPNVALIVTLQPPPDGRKDRLIFGEFLMWKTREYLEGNPRVAAAVVNTIRPDTVFIPYHWPGNKAANQLTIRAVDPQSKMPEFKVAAVRVTPATGRPG